MQYNGMWYAEIIESERHVGTRTISVHEFDSEDERDAFIIDFNTNNLPDIDYIPAVYQLAQWADYRVIKEYLRGKSDV